MNGRAWLRLGAKTLHDVASITFGGAVAACLLINLTTHPAAPAEFLPARQIVTAIARYLLVPSMAVVVLSGLLALSATRAYREAGWAWLKALLGITVMMATLMLAGAAGPDGELAAAARAADLATLQSLLRSERNTLWLLLLLSAVNVVLAVWRPKLLLTVH